MSFFFASYRCQLLYLTCCILLTNFHLLAQINHQQLSAPSFPREFRAAWIATIYGIDWPSKKGLSKKQQQHELQHIVRQAKKIGLNALILQVRPESDAFYNSKIEPWSQWLTGTMGKSPGYDPLRYFIYLCRLYAIEPHVWINPFRALLNHSKTQTHRKHISRRLPQYVLPYKNLLWVKPSSPTIQQYILQIIEDIVKRYDIDGIHIDDYFYPYPTIKDGQVVAELNDGLSPAQRRNAINKFVKQFYQRTKLIKPYLRVGISPFGIWQPDYPRGIIAQINAYQHLAADAKKWLQSGWCDYLAPQIYWASYDIERPYQRILEWWQQQSARAVWPGIASSRILSSEDPQRRAEEIIRQIVIERNQKRYWHGHIHWSINALIQNKDNIANKLKLSVYRFPALTPPVRNAPITPPLPAPKITIRTYQQKQKHCLQLQWSKVAGAYAYTIQVYYQNKWYPVAVLSPSTTKFTLAYQPDIIAIRAINRYGKAGTLLQLKANSESSNSAAH